MSGQSLVEIILVIALSAIVLPALVTGLITSRSGKPQQEQRLRASGYLREMQEAVRAMREDDWENFDSPGIYHPQIQSGRWVLVSGPEIISPIEGLSRQIEVENVFRDNNGEIVVTGGILDPSTKRFIFMVSWTSPYASSIDSTMYLTRLANESYTETTLADFSLGSPVDTVIDDSLGGEIFLGGGGQGDWCEPNLSITGLDLPKSGVANAILAVEGRAYVGTGDNASGETFVDVSISQDDPPVASKNGVLDCSASCPKTNDVYGVGDYAFVATDTNDSEIIILDISNTPIQIGKFNADGPQDASSVWVKDNYGFMTQDKSTFHVFDLSSKSGDRPHIAELALADNGNDIFIVGDYAYVAIDSSSTQLQIIDISNPSSPSIVSSLKVANKGGKAVYINSSATRAYIATGYNSGTSLPTEKEMHIVDISNKQNPTWIGSYDTGAMDPTDITVVTNNKAIIVGIGGEEYQVINYANESTPLRCGGLSVDVGINGIDSVLESDGDAFSYIITKDADEEFRIIKGGPGNFSDQGTFESATFEPNPNIFTTYNRFTASISQPSQTSISVQVAGADPVEGSCSGASFSFVGPDRTDQTFFVSSDGQTIEAPIPFDNDGLGYENPAQCFRYKVFFQTGDVSQTPVLYDMTINYAL